MSLRLTINWETLRQDVRVPLLAMVILGLLILHQVWLCFQLFFVSPSFAPQNINMARPHAFNTPAISQYHVFGQYNPESMDLPLTALQLTLEGIAFSNEANQSLAIISRPGLLDKIYRVGDGVYNDAVVQQILRDQVILNDHGHLERLNLPVPKISGILTQVNP